MSKKRVFLLTGATLAVYGRRDGKLVRLQAFRNDPGGLREFAKYLDEDPWTPIRFLVDLVEEEFRLETIPHVFGSDRRALVVNRARRLFHDTPYWHTVFQGRESGGRRDDQVLFAAVSHPAVLECWLDPIARRKIPLIGIYSLAILSKRLLPHIGAPTAKISDTVLLVHCNADGGLRQSFFYRQHLKVSRIAMAPQIGGTDDEAVAAYIPGEVENIRRYLDGLGLLPSDRPLEVYFLGNAGILRYPERQITDAPNLHYHFLDMAKVDIGIDSSDELDGLHADALFAGILLRSTLADYTPTHHILGNHYAPPSDLRDFQSTRIRLAIYAFAVVLLGMGIVGGMFPLSEILVIEQRTAALTKQADIYEDRYARFRSNSPKGSADGPTLRAVVETAMALQRSKTTPYGMLSALGEVLDRKTDLEIEEIEWSASADPNASVDAHGAPERGSGTRAKPIRTKPVSPKPRPGSDKMGVNRYQIALIKGRVAAFSGDYRAANRLVEDFAKALSRIEAMEEVRIIKRPLNISSGETLVGKTGAVGNAHFVLRVVLLGNPGL